MKVAFHTLGCKVNQYESEAMAGNFKAEGYEVVDERDFSDVYIINTCTVTAVAVKKSRQYIRRMKNSLRTKNAENSANWHLFAVCTISSSEMNCIFSNPSII